MSLSPDDPVLTRARETLSPFGVELLERCAAFALELHAEELSPEHLLVALMRAEESGVHRAALFAFADPETVAAEALALAPGILVVGSSRSMPFSVAGAAALRAARQRAVEAGADSVTPGDVLLAAVDALTPEAREALGRSGFDGGGVAAQRGPSEAGATPLHDGGEVLAGYSSGAMRALGVACRTAVQLSREAISPAHLIFATLEVDGALAERAGTLPMRVRSSLTGLDVDPATPPERALVADERLAALLADVPAGSGSVGLYASLVDHATAEMRQLLDRHKLGPEFAARARGGFDDPA